MVRYDSELIRDRRRALVDALRAIHTRNGKVRIDLVLAQGLEAAWRAYDQAIADQAIAEHGRREGQPR
jgi:hypothetical protein